MRPFPRQRKYKTLKAALNCSIRKWEYFSTCTRAELDEHRSHILKACGLCLFHGDREHRCDNCDFGDCFLCVDANDLFDEANGRRPTMKDFHKAARKVLKALKELK